MDKTVIIEKLNKSVTNLGKMFLNEGEFKGDFAPFVHSLSPYVDVVSEVTALNPTTYDINDYTEEKGRSALDFIKNNVRQSFVKVDETKGYATTIHNNLIRNLTDAEEEYTKISGVILNSLMRALNEDIAREVIATLNTRIEKTYQYGGFQSIYDLAINPTAYIAQTDDAPLRKYNVSDLIIIAPVKNMQLIREKAEKSTTKVFASGEPFKETPSIILIPDAIWANEDTKAFIISKDALKIFIKYQEIDNQYNAKYGFTNYFLKTSKSVYLSPFELATKLTL